MSSPLLQARNVKRCYASKHRGRRGQPVEAVAGVDLSIEHGDTMAIIGESGAGKSTLSRILLGLEPCDEGSVHFDGHQISNRPDRSIRRLRRRFQPVFQDPSDSLSPLLRVGAIVSEPLGAHTKNSRSENELRVREVLEMVGLPATVIEQRPREFSAGQRQRIAIARALVTAPELLVLDEPVSSLDPPVRHAIVSLLSQLHTKLGVSLLMVSHDLDTARRLCRETVVMFDGRVIEQGPTEIVLSRPWHPYTQSLLDAEPHWDDGVPKAAETSDSASAEPRTTACCYRHRCAEALDVCAAAPSLEPGAENHKVACWVKPA